MMFKVCASIIAVIFLVTSGLCAEEKDSQGSDQQINDFSLAGFGEKGKKSWELSGKSADIFDEVVKLKDVVGNLYGAEEDVNLTADKGDFNKSNGKIHLEKNVVITTSSGTNLTTDSLDWDRKNQLVTTPDIVNIKKEDMLTTGKGAVGKMDLNQVTLQKDVQVDIIPQAKEGKPALAADRIVINCDGPLEVDYAKNIATFRNNVKVEREDSTIYCDKMDIYFLTSDKDKAQAGAAPSLLGNKIDRLIARGNVKIVRGENISYSEEATYSASDRKIVLTGRPKLILYSAEDITNAPSGN